MNQFLGKYGPADVPAGPLRFKPTPPPQTTNSAVNHLRGGLSSCKRCVSVNPSDLLRMAVHN
jgi:hypothetical protein